LGRKSLYFASLCPNFAGSQGHAPCGAWKFDNYQLLRKIVAVGDTVQASIRTFFAGVKNVAVTEVSEVWPSVDGTREFVYLHVTWDRYGVVGMFEIVNGVFCLLIQDSSITTGATMSRDNGIWADGSGIVFLQFGPASLPSGWQEHTLLRFNEKTGQTEVVLRDGMELFGEKILVCALAHNFEVSKLFVRYSNQYSVYPPLINRLASLMGNSLEKIIGNDSLVPVWGVRGEIAENSYLRLVPIVQGSDGKATHGFVDALGVQFVSEPERIRSLVKTGDSVMGRPVERFNNDYADVLVAVHGCDAEFATFRFGGSVDRWYRFSFACIQQWPTLVKSGEEVVLKGQNLSVAGSLVEVVATDDLSKKTTITPTRISPTEVVFLAPAATGSHSFQVRVTYGARVSVSNIVSTNVTGPPPPPLPSFTASGVVNGASFKPGISPGALASIFGTNLAAKEATATALPLPTTLGGMQVTFDGHAAPLWYVNPTQINLEVPCELGSPADVRVQVTRDGVQSGVVMVHIDPDSPGAFMWGTYGITTHADYRLATPQDPLRPLEPGILWATGLGITNPCCKSGEPASVGMEAYYPISLRIDGMEAQILWAGLSPGSVGLYQVNFITPEGVSNGVGVLTVNGTSSSPQFQVPVSRD
jgi:uncharacterized protein (TIGR03437 family)